MSKDKSEEQHESDVAENIHVGVSKSTGGGRCLNRHEAAWREHSCSHRWQAYQHALSDSALYDYPAYKRLVDRGRDVRTDARKDHTSSSGTFYPIYPEGYSFFLKAPKQGEWDVGAGRNFKWDCRVPYLHNAHHVVPNSKLRGAIDKSEKKFTGFRLVVRKGLARADYNLNHLDNMVILPMDSKVAGALNLPRHLITVLYRDHTVYSKYVAQELGKIMQKYEEQLSDYFEKKQKEHVKMTHQLCKASIESLSKRLYKQITARRTKAERAASGGTPYQGTLDTAVKS
jgi:hypothetical protein